MIGNDLCVTANALMTWIWPIRSCEGYTKPYYWVGLMTIPWITKIYAAQYAVHDFLTTLYRISRKEQTTKPGGKTTKRKERSGLFLCFIFWGGGSFVSCGSPPPFLPCFFIIFWICWCFLPSIFFFPCCFPLCLLALSFILCHMCLFENKVNSVPTNVSTMFLPPFLSPNRSHLLDLQVVTSPASKAHGPKVTSSFESKLPSLGTENMSNCESTERSQVALSTNKFLFFSF